MLKKVLSFGLCKTESDTPDSIDILIGRDLLYLGSDITDMDVDRLVLADIALIPCILEDLLLGEDLVGIEHEKLQDLILLSCKEKVFAAKCCFESILVKDKVTILKRALLFCLLASDVGQVTELNFED